MCRELLLAFWRLLCVNIYRSIEGAHNAWPLHHTDLAKSKFAKFYSYHADLDKSTLAKIRPSVARSLLPLQRSRLLLFHSAFSTLHVPFLGKPVAPSLFRLAHSLPGFHAYEDHSHRSDAAADLTAAAEQSKIRVLAAGIQASVVAAAAARAEAAVARVPGKTEVAEAAAASAAEARAEAAAAVATFQEEADKIKAAAAVEKMIKAAAAVHSNGNVSVSVSAFASAGARLVVKRAETEMSVAAEKLREAAAVAKNAEATAARFAELPQEQDEQKKPK